MVGADRALVRCLDVGRRYGSGPNTVIAVYSVTCEIAPGDQVAVVGPSGSGKSTLLHLFAGLEVPTAGSIQWPGLGDHPRAADSVGLVFQTPSLIASMTVRENVELPLLLADTDPQQARSRADQALELLGLADLRDNLPQELSGGQAQRVVIARVLACRPRLILADEPTSQLDRDTADHVAEVLIDVSRDIGAALVVATHDPLISERLPDEWPMRDGKLSHLDVYDLSATPSDEAARP